jgi:ubiquitin C-terminal hydrolase
MLVPTLEVVKQEMSENKGLIGLTNIGNTCYGNATIQAIRHQIDFTIFLLQDHHKELLKNKKSSEKTRLLESYGDLVRELWTSESSTNIRTALPSDYKSNRLSEPMNMKSLEKGYTQTRPMWSSMIPAAILAGVDHFRMPVAHDAHEFLVFLLDQFHEAMAEEVTMVVKTSPEKKHTREALEFWKRSFEKSYSPLVELVFGLQRKAVVCQVCGKESPSWETMNMFKVSVPTERREEPYNLLELMREEANAEEIDEYSCEGCKPTRTKAKITHTLWRLGNWVIVVLKRNENTGRRINTPVEIPFNTTFTELFHPDSAEPSKTDTYELFSTIHHHGSAGGGHYTSHAKHPVNHKWAHYDDERVYEVDGNPELGPSTYIVMYRRRTA